MQIDSLEQQYISRPYNPDGDIPHLSHMLSDIEAVDHDGEETSEEALRAQLTWPNYHPEQDCHVIEAPGDPHTLIGYSSVFAQTAERSTLYIAVHPHWRRRGLGSALLAGAVRRAQETRASYVTINANARNKAANTFLRQHGFSLAGSAWTLLAPPGITLEEARWPAGYTVQSYAGLQHLPAVVEVHNRSFADQWGHAENYQATTGELILNWLSSTDPAGVFLAFAPGGSVAGFCRALLATENDNPDGNGTDQLDAPGVVPEHRHQGLYRPLVLTAMHWLRAQARHPIILQSWGDSDQTIAVYRDVGFELLQHFFAYRCDLH
jgi:mycothiol synthase